MIDGKEIRVQCVGDALRKATLCLHGTVLTYRGNILTHHGTVLTYRGKKWRDRFSLDIPIELISFIEKKQFNGKRLISAAAILWIPIAVLLTVNILAFSFVEKHVLDEVAGMMMLISFFPCILYSVFNLVLFFMRQKTITIHIASDDIMFSFWLSQGNIGDIQELMQVITLRQEQVVDTISHPLGFAVEATQEMFWPFTIVLVLGILGIAEGLNFPWLSITAIIPVGYHLFLVAKEPRLYQKAIKCMTKEKYTRAKELTHVLIQNKPEYLPAKLLLIKIFVRQEDYVGAESILSDIQNDLDTEALHDIQEGIMLCRRLSARKRERFQV